MGFMNLSARSSYALGALVVLAEHPGQLLHATELAGLQALQGRYLYVILNALRRARLVSLVRGKGGGYRLARPPAQISLADVLEAVDGPLFEAPASDANGSPVLRQRIETAWGQVAGSLVVHMRTVSLDQLAAGEVFGR